MRQRQFQTHWKRKLLLFITLVCFSVARVNLDANDEKSITGRGSKQISDVNMLLPVSLCSNESPACRRVSYQISAVNGCYQWEVSHPNLIRITSVPSKFNPECTNIALVKAISDKPSKSLIWVSAKDVNSGQVLRCEVKLGKIAKLKLQTHLRQIYLNDFEHIQMVAYDEEGNIFSGLDGFRFDWNIEEGNDNVRFSKFSEAAHSHSHYRQEIGEMQSDVLFLKGIKQGLSVITAAINEPGYESIIRTRVNVTVVEPFVIEPQKTVYIAPVSRYNFKLNRVIIKDNDMSFSPIKLPSIHYEWNVDDKSLGIISEDGVFISRDEEGLAEIQVVDKQIRNNTAEGSVRVVYPYSLDISLTDVTSQLVDQKVFIVESEGGRSFQEQLNVTQFDNNNYFVIGHYYLITLNIFDKDKNNIIITDNLILKTLIDKEYFETVKINKLNSQIIVKAVKTTPKNKKTVVYSVLEQIKSQYAGLIYQVDTTKLRQEKDIVISEIVRINHPTVLVLLPIIKSEDHNSGELWQLSAIGGSGFYHWDILNKSVAVVSGAGLLKSLDYGKTEVIAIDSQNNKNKFSLSVEVTSITSLKWLEEHVEVARASDDDVVLSLQAFDKEGRKFTNCTSVDATFDLKGAGILKPDRAVRNFDLVKGFVYQNKQLLDLKLKFDQNPKANLESELPVTPFINNQTENLYLHNNFGICSQIIYKPSHIESGLARIKAAFVNKLSQSSSQILETTYAEVAVYDHLQSRLPSYNEFFNSLYSKSHAGQDLAEFSKYYKDQEYPIAYGSQITWLVTGGTNFWKDIPEKYRSKIDIQYPKENVDVIKVKKVNEQTTNFEYQIQCQKSRSSGTQQFRHIVNLEQGNQASRTLLRPATHHIKLLAICTAPSALNLFWSQENSTLPIALYRKLPSYRVFEKEKRYFVLTNSEHYMRALLLDKNGMALYNFTGGVNIDYSSSDLKMVEGFIVNDIDQRLVKFKNQTGTVYITAQASEYKEAKDQMRVEVVRNVDIHPNYKSIYLHKNNHFSFKILHGSGHFSVSINDTSIADKAVQDDGRVVTIIPKKEGPIEIRVEDIEIPDSVVSVSELLVSDVSRLFLDAPGTLIEQGSSMNLTVTAYDSYGVEFDQDQYEHMQFNIEIEITQPRVRGLSAETNPLNNREFVAKGYEPGNYQTAAFTYKYRQANDISFVRFNSEVLKVEVFPQLEFHPNGLLLTPNMRYTLMIVGGPSDNVYSQAYHGGHVSISFQVHDTSIANVDQSREVTGRLVGDTYLYYEIVQIRPSKHSTIVSSKIIPIRVRLPTKIDIPFNNQRTVYVGSMVKLLGILKYHNETFTHGIAPISYSWNVSNPNVLTLTTPQIISTQIVLAATKGALPPSQVVLQSKKVRDNTANNNNAVFTTLFNSSTLYSTGVKQGEVQITLQLAVDYPEQYRNERNWFTTTINMSVKEKLSVGIPEFINNAEKQTHLYLMPPNTYSKIETNRKTRLRLGYSQQSVYDYTTNSYEYKDSQTPIIQLVNEEGIRTLDKHGKVTVIIEENSALSDQVVMLNLLITDIFTITTKDVYQTLSFPLGSQMNIPIKFQNEHGHQFANNIEGIEVGIELSHPKVISARLDPFNQTIIMSAEGSGECNVMIYLIKTPQIYDIFRVRVSSVVKPFSPVHVHVGGNIQFKIMDQGEVQYTQTSSADQNIWSSNHPQILEINQRSGFATALQEGKSEILLSNNINAASLVHVSRVKHAEIDQTSRKNLILNTDEKDVEKRIKLKLYLADSAEELSPSVQFDGVTLIQNNVGLTCESDQPTLINTKGEIDELEGFFCSISLKPHNKPYPRSAQITVSVYGINPRDPRNIKSALYNEKLLTFDVTLLSRIKIEPKYREGVSLYSDARTANIRVQSTVPFSTNIEYASFDEEELVKYKVQKYSEESNDYVITVTIPQEISHNFAATLNLVHSVTQAKTRIPLAFENRVSGIKATASPRKPDITQQQPTQEVNYDKPSAPFTWVQLFTFTFLGGVTFCFILVNFFRMDPLEFVRDLWNLRNPCRQRPPQPARRAPPGAIRQSSIIPNNLSQYPNSRLDSFRGDGQQPAAQRPYAQPLSANNYSLDSIRRNQSIIYHANN